ncbi:MAG: RNA 2',3'-cyclic phosphodiesterase [Planctomycetota bacterium]
MRLFVAVYPPMDVVEAMLAPLRGIDLPRCRFPPDKQVHLTLHFIGDTESRALEGVVESIERAVAGIGPWHLQAERLMTLPVGGRPKLIAAGTTAPSQLLEVQRRLVQRFARAPRSKPGNRYVPHITLCRLQRGAGPVPPLPAIDVPAFEVCDVLLMRSVLKPTGAEHAEVTSVALDK